jgi:hypothetical protein
VRRTPMIRPRRRGIASLELVLVFPMVLAIAAALFLIGHADVAKLAAATAARRQTWQERAEAPAGQRLRPWHNPQDSQISSQPVQSVSMGPLFSGQTRQAQSGNTVIANTWAFEAIPFPPLKKNMLPHTSVLALIGTDVSTAIFQGFQLLFDPGLDFGGNPVLQAARITGIGENVVVKAAGYALEFSIGAAINVQISILNRLWDALEASTLGFAGLTSEGKKIKKALNLLTTYLNCFHNLYEASQGRPGDDPYAD